MISNVKQNFSIGSNTRLNWNLISCVSVVYTKYYFWNCMLEQRSWNLNATEKN